MVVDDQALALLIELLYVLHEHVLRAFFAVRIYFSDMVIFTPVGSSIFLWYSDAVVRINKD